MSSTPTLKDEWEARSRWQHRAIKTMELRELLRNTQPGSFDYPEVKRHYEGWRGARDKAKQEYDEIRKARGTYCGCDSE